MYYQLMTFLWYSLLLLAPSVWFTHFYLNLNRRGISRLCTGTLFLPQSKLSLTGLIFIHGLFCSSYFSRTFPDFVKSQDISRTWRINLLFSRFSRMHGNPVITVDVNIYHTTNTHACYDTLKLVIQQKASKQDDQECFSITTTFIPHQTVTFIIG